MYWDSLGESIMNLTYTKNGLYIYLNSTSKCNSRTGCERSGAAVGFALFSPSNKRRTNETLQPTHARTKIHNIFDA